MRLPAQVLVVPYQVKDGELLFTILKRRDMDMWQWIAGGVEENESIVDAALRESEEELGIHSSKLEIMPLESKCSIPKLYFEARKNWPDDIYTVTEHTFAVRMAPDSEISLSSEHSLYKIIKFSELENYNTWDSNRTAAWELHQRLLSMRLISR
ncbi:NUDIX domain-containing protein [Xenorhabdus sp. Vera]|uniref:NUDIX hydrolase n=1 Tax=Xenorhabdus koppenhoeferi TaxID=351659 RepID=UPI0019A93F00|nr:NUDIX domain-containing protein [Xenorhabdus sp. Vera]MBD2809862.1 NUDIX domain-containing protein [Xenorhabdus sp. Vera]